MGSSVGRWKGADSKLKIQTWKKRSLMPGGANLRGGKLKKNGQGRDGVGGGTGGIVVRAIQSPPGK